MNTVEIATNALDRNEYPGERRLTRSDLFIIMFLVGSAVAIGVFVFQSLTLLREELPQALLEQQRDVSYLVQELGDMVHAIEMTRLKPGQSDYANVRQHLKKSVSRLSAIRGSYEFDNLIGASAVHALVNPALQDVQNWLDQGVSGLPASSPLVLDLILHRSQEVYRNLQTLFGNANDAAITVIMHHGSTIEHFRNNMILYLTAFSLFVGGVIVLYIHRRRTETRLAQARNRLTESIESINEGFVLLDSRDRVILCNQRFQNLLPADLRDNLQGASFEQLLGGISQDNNFVVDENWVQQQLHKRQSAQDSFEFQHRSGSIFSVREYKTQGNDSVGIYSDITQVKRTQQKLEHLASHDPLTGLVNRSHFETLLHKDLLSIRTTETDPIAVLYVDLDRFKLVNDTFGHGAGDTVLEDAARKMQSCLRDRDTVARIGGDEFAVILRNLQTHDEAAVLAKKVLTALSSNLDIQGRDVYVTASIGIALPHQDGADVKTLIKNADMACYHAKSTGRNSYQYFSRAMANKAERRMELERHLSRALENDELDVKFQPQLDLTRGEIVGMEALARWTNPVLGEVSPQEFIPVAEEIGLIAEIDDWVLHRACRVVRKWQKNKLKPVSMSVNLSARSFHNEQLVPTIEKCLQENALAADSLILEITETAVIDPVPPVVESLRRVDEMGVRLAIDDFGTGYSSLATLKRFPIRLVKVDQSFVQNIMHDSDDKEIVSAVIAVAHKLNIRVIAEGVENIQQLKILKGQECDSIQGFILSKPLSAKDATQFLEPDYSPRELHTLHLA